LKDDVFEKEMKISPLIRKYLYISIFIPLIIILVSIIFSMYFKDWGLFSRSGSIIVIVGIYIAYKEFSGKIYELSTDNYLTMKDLLELRNIHLLDDQDYIDGQIKQENINAKKNNNIRKFAKYAGSKFRAMELALLASGTFIWGYGDLIMNLLWGFNA
jgi:hypothetical protein